MRRQLLKEEQMYSSFLSASKSPGEWVAGRSAQVKEEPAKRAGDTEQNVLPPTLLSR
jgi:hypothetical protein